MFPAGGHLGSDPDLLDTILKGNYPRTIVTKFDSSWRGGFRGEVLRMCFPIVSNVKVSSPLAPIVDRTQFLKGMIQEPL